MFRFQFQKLLDLRRNARDECRAELANASQAERLLREEIDRITAEQVQLQDCIRQASQPGSVPIEHLRGAHRYQRALAAQLRTLEHRSAQLANQIACSRQRLLEAQRQLRVMERLCEKKKTRHQQKAAIQQRRRLDEIALRSSLGTKGVLWER
jgi:flagellar FliJ protein